MKDQLREVNINKLVEIQGVIDLLPQALYSDPQELFEGSTLGQHFRHIIEFYSCLLKGVANKDLCYDDRDRDLRLENDPQFAKDTCEQMIPLIGSLELDRSLELGVCYGRSEEGKIPLVTSVERELAYALDHAIHHLAMIRIILRKEGVQLDPSVGVAPATIRFREACAQ